jgi:hypothetical protein
MSTTPVTPAPTPAPVAAKPATPSAATTVANHPIIHLLLAASLVYGGIVGIEDLLDRHDQKAAAAQLTRENVDTSTTTALLAQLQKQQADDEARDAQAMATIQSLAKQMSISRSQTAQQIATDVTLDAQTAATKLVAQTKTSPSDAAASGNTVVVSLPLARIIVANLDELPQAQADVTNLQGQLVAETTLATDTKAQLDTANQTIDADKVELVAAVKADNAQCKVEVDAQAKKDRKRGFWVTLLAIAGGVALRSAL